MFYLRMPEAWCTQVSPFVYLQNSLLNSRSKGVSSVAFYLLFMNSSITESAIFDSMMHKIPLFRIYEHAQI